MKAPLITSSEQKHSTVDVTENDQTPVSPAAATSNSNLGMLLLVGLLSLTPLMDFMGIVYGRGNYYQFIFYNILQCLTVACYIQHGFVALLLKDDVPTYWDQFLAYLFCDSCSQKPKKDDRVAMREAIITRRGRPGALLTFHLLVGIVINYDAALQHTFYRFGEFYGATAFVVTMWGILYQSRKAILRNFPDKDKIGLRVFVSKCIKYFLLTVFIQIYIVANYFNFIVQIMPNFSYLIEVDGKNKWSWCMCDTFDTLMQTSLAMGFHWLCVFWWSLTAQGSGLLNLQSIHSCQIRITHLIQTTGVFVTTLIFIYLHTFNSHVYTAMTAALTQPNATRCHTFECVCKEFYPNFNPAIQQVYSTQVFSTEWDRYRLANHLIFIIWGVIFLLLIIDLILKRFADSSIAGKLLHYRDSNGNKMKFHVFISHSQSTGGHQTRLLYTELEKRGIIVWYDQIKNNPLVDVRAPGMVKGVESSAVFLLFLSGNKKDGTSPLRRPYCQLEIETARVTKRPLVVMYEKLDDANKFDWDFDTKNCQGTKKLVTEDSGLIYPQGESFNETALQDYAKTIGSGHRAIMYDRDLGKIDGMMNDLMKQIEVAMDQTNLSNSERSSTMSLN